MSFVQLNKEIFTPTLAKCTHARREHVTIHHNANMGGFLPKRRRTIVLSDTNPIQYCSSAAAHLDYGIVTRKSILETDNVSHGKGAPLVVR